jgi:hypothetical protein
MSIEPRRAVRTDTRWFRFLNAAIDAASAAGLGAHRMAALDAGFFDARRVAPHEGLHRRADPRYKEWWYFDAHLEDGTVLSMSVVFSIVRTHWFLWVYDPASGRVSEEIMADGPVQVNACGGAGGSSTGLEMVGPDFSVAGGFDKGYHLEFRGKTAVGSLEFSDPVAGRAECHAGPSRTRYGLYQVPRMSVRGTLGASDGSAQRAVSGSGYHDHWWCISHRVTRWNWMQASFPGGWTLSFYDAAYGYRAEDCHRYGWILTPEGHYQHFDTASMDFKKGTDGWSISASGPAGALGLEARPRVQRFEFKPVVLAGFLLGEVQYFQYPVTVKAVFTPAGGRPVSLETATGMLEWDWVAVW